ncbi:hypothetical protein Tco_0652870 [Tanacetum coccineum]|uniref:CCHC-type domain-containing protein n=1 Tax=Tanacetum coccineum TaxID=301880 RepID=A0ABQ4WYU7_9ASTR
MVKLRFRIFKEQSQGYSVNAGKSQATGTRVINTVGEANTNQLRAIMCYNCRGEGHMAKSTRILADILEEMEDCDDLQLQKTSNFKACHVDAYDSDYDDEATASAIFMASLSLVGSLNGDTVAPTYNSHILSEVPHYDTYHENDVLNLLFKRRSILNT